MRRALRWALTLYGLFLVYGTCVPFRLAPGKHGPVEFLQELAMRWAEPPPLPDLVANVLLFIPWGLLAAAWWRGRGGSVAAARLAAVGSAGLLSTGVEFLQVFLDRTSSPHDILANIAGAALGALVVGPRAERWAPRLAAGIREEFRRRPARTALLAIYAAVALAGLAPYDLTLDVGLLRGALKRLQPIPFGPTLAGHPHPFSPWAFAADLTFWVLVGGAGGLCHRLDGLGRLAAWRAAVLGGTAVAFGIEVLQVFVYSRTADADSLLAAVLGCALGATATAVAPRAEAARWRAPGLAIWTASLLLERWTPPRFRIPEQLSPLDLVPFYAYYRRTDLHAVADLLREAGSYAPLGLLLSLGSHRPSPTRAAVAGALAGLGVEIGQVFHPGRSGEITDVLSAAAGAALGAWAWRQGLETLGGGAAAQSKPEDSA